MILHKTLKIVPSEWELDVFVAPFEDELELCKVFHKRYGASAEYYAEEMGQGNWVWSIDSTDDSEMKGKKLIVMKLRKLDLGVLVHELNHVMWHYSRYSGAKLCYDSQEWGSLLIEYLFNQTYKEDSYQELKPELAI